MSDARASASTIRSDALLYLYGYGLDKMIARNSIEVMLGKTAMSQAVEIESDEPIEASNLPKTAARGAIRIGEPQVVDASFGPLAAPLVLPLTVDVAVESLGEAGLEVRWVGDQEIHVQLFAVPVPVPEPQPEPVP